MRPGRGPNHGGMFSHRISSPKLSRWALSLIAFGLLTRQFLLWQQLSFDELRFGALGSVFLALLVWDKRRTAVLDSGPAATSVGVLLVCLFLFQANSSPGPLFTAFAPMVWGIGLIFLAAGFGGLKQFWKEAFVLLLLALPFFVRWLVFDAIGYNVSPIVAGASAAVSWALGWPAEADGDVVHVAGKTVMVYQACSGLKSMFLTTGLAVFLLLVFPPAGRLRKAGAIIGAWLAAFVVNVSRVTLLVVLTSTGNDKAFHYWHTQDGALLFEILAIVVFILIYRFALMTGGAEPIQKGATQ